MRLRRSAPVPAVFQQPWSAQLAARTDHRAAIGCLVRRGAAKQNQSGSSATTATMLEFRAENIPYSLDLDEKTIMANV